jgi:short-subunit dehydrogenase
MAVYYASKAYVLSFSFALSVELKRSGVTVTALCPGPTLSGFQRTAGIRETGAARALNMRAVPVALAGYRGMMRGRRVVTPGIRNKAWLWVTRVLPRTLGATLAGWHNVRRETPDDH